MHDKQPLSLDGAAPREKDTRSDGNAPPHAHLDVRLNARVRAAYRAHACAASIAVGAMTFTLGAGVALPLCLNAAYISALSVLPMAALTAFIAQRALCRQAAHRGASCSGTSRALSVLLALTLTACALLLLEAIIGLTEKSLLPLAREMWTVSLVLLAAGLCAWSGFTGVSRLCFMLRLLLPLGLLLLSAQALTLDARAGLFPLLGTGMPWLGLSALYMLGATSPALMLALPPPELAQAGEDAQRCPVPKAGFFVGRVVAGAAMGVALLGVLAMCNAYESIGMQRAWGERMFILCCNEPREGVFQSLLTLLQITAMALGAASLLCAAEQAVSRACPQLGRHRAGLGLCWLLCAAALIAMCFVGNEGALWSAPLLGVPLIVLLLGGRRL